MTRDDMGSGYLNGLLFNARQTAESNGSSLVRQRAVAALIRYEYARATSARGAKITVKDCLVNEVVAADSGEHPASTVDNYSWAMKRYVIPRIGVQELGRLTPAKVVTESLGDANISITLDACSRLLPALQEDASEKNAALILGGNS